jgi:hypothetical protein
LGSDSRKGGTGGGERPAALPVTYSDGGTAMLNRDEPLEVSDEIDDFGDHYLITEVDHPISEHGKGTGMGHVPAGGGGSAPVALRSRSSFGDERDIAEAFRQACEFL